MKRKFLLSISAISALSAMPLMAAACGNKKYSHPKQPSQSVVNIKFNDSFKLTEEQIKKAPKIVMINDGGDLNDKSFNQSAWEGLLNFADLQNKFPYSQFDVIEVKNSQFAQAYQTALEGKYQIWIAPGYLHGDHIGTFVKANEAKIKENKVVIIGADYTSELSGHGIYQHFKTKEAAFMAGYAAGMFLSNETDPKNRTVSSFGGGIFPGVTDFIEGFYKGILWWNNQQTDENKKVHTLTDTVDLSSGFEITPKMNSTIDSVLALNPKMVLPVAGPATNVLINNERSKDKYIVGVDTDQSLSAPKNKEWFFTSILKSIGQSTYDTVGRLASTQDLASESDKLGKFELDKKDGNQVGGYNENWVDVAPTSITDPAKRQLAVAALQKGKEVFKKLTPEEKDYLASKRALKDGTEYNTEQERLNALSKELMKK
ncbi:lipoprotein [Mycoplasmopsis bovigenitalium]|uniref:BMP family ABC transporter substrate-binding protein n=1 Tax=Mycoplasmopsis bovigenitalium TaxID=2112 RepID=UPI00090CD463|nr:BMP family ABC transporter substrate-binding protein [Mycoplasmopsis bovigenitalium]BAW18319.1 lipoprotein [Mycoplasmopsis bovigenitalium]